MVTIAGKRYKEHATLSTENIMQSRILTKREGWVSRITQHFFFFLIPPVMTGFILYESNFPFINLTDGAQLMGLLDSVHRGGR